MAVSTLVITSASAASRQFAGVSNINAARAPHPFVCKSTLVVSVCIAATTAWNAPASPARTRVCGTSLHQSCSAPRLANSTSWLASSARRTDTNSSTTTRAGTAEPAAWSGLHSYTSATSASASQQATRTASVVVAWVSCTKRSQSLASSAAATSASFASSLIAAAPSLCAGVPAEVRSRSADGACRACSDGYRDSAHRERAAEVGADQLAARRGRSALRRGFPGAQLQAGAQADAKGGAQHKTRSHTARRSGGTARRREERR